MLVLGAIRPPATFNMVCPSTFPMAFTSILRHNASSAGPRLIVPSTRLFHTSRSTSDSFHDILSKTMIPAGNSTEGVDVLREFDNIFTQNFSALEPSKETYHLHIYSTKHNTHITFTDPNKNPIISVSAGNLGFKKAQRGTYDAAYQLASHVFAKLEEKPIRPKALEVVLRDFGEGREAAVKALLGTEGRNLKGAITRVTDATRLKFGGTRSKAPRRLG
ncbi:mitochondrial ribosomal protein subunit S18 [Tirmania nivea]|nr:mitochondrial ribosomal protein subunit S18 [Tirmania nivea]